MIRVGIGGWVYAPWHGTFYPEGLPRARALEYASRRLTAIEINATFYRLQSPASFAKWRDEAPPGFVFAVKAPRFATHRKVLAEAGEAVERFVASGIAELGSKLGPIAWQFAPKRGSTRRTSRHFCSCSHEAAPRVHCDTRSTCGIRVSSAGSSSTLRAGTMLPLSRPTARTIR